MYIFHYYGPMALNVRIKAYYYKYTQYITGLDCPPIHHMFMDM